MSIQESPRRHILLPWAVQEREDPVLEFDHGEGVYFFDPYCYRTDSSRRFGAKKFGAGSARNSVPVADTPGSERRRPLRPR